MIEENEQIRDIKNDNEDVSSNNPSKNTEKTGLFYTNKKFWAGFIIGALLTTIGILSILSGATVISWAAIIPLIPAGWIMPTAASIGCYAGGSAFILAGLLVFVLGVKACRGSAQHNKVLSKIFPKKNNSSEGIKINLNQRINPLQYNNDLQYDEKSFETIKLIHTYHPKDDCLLYGNKLKKLWGYQHDCSKITNNLLKIKDKKILYGKMIEKLDEWIDCTKKDCFFFMSIKKELKTISQLSNILDNKNQKKTIFNKLLSLCVQHKENLTHQKEQVFNEKGELFLYTIDIVSNKEKREAQLKFSVKNLSNGKIYKLVKEDFLKDKKCIVVDEGEKKIYIPRPIILKEFIRLITVYSTYASDDMRKLHDVIDGCAKINEGNSKEFTVCYDDSYISHLNNNDDYKNKDDLNKEYFFIDLDDFKNFFGEMKSVIKDVMFANPAYLLKVSKFDLVFDWSVTNDEDIDQWFDHITNNDTGSIISKIIDDKSMSNKNKCNLIEKICIFFKKIDKRECRLTLDKIAWPLFDLLSGNKLYADNKIIKKFITNQLLHHIMTVSSNRYLSVEQSLFIANYIIDTYDEKKYLEYNSFINFLIVRLNTYKKNKVSKNLYDKSFFFLPKNIKESFEEKYLNSILGCGFEGDEYKKEKYDFFIFFDDYTVSSDNIDYYVIIDNKEKVIESSILINKRDQLICNKKNNLSSGITFFKKNKNSTEYSFENKNDINAIRFQIIDDACKDDESIKYIYGFINTFTLDENVKKHFLNALQYYDYNQEITDQKNQKNLFKKFSPLMEIKDHKKINKNNKDENKNNLKENKTINSKNQKELLNAIITQNHFDHILKWFSEDSEYQQLITNKHTKDYVDSILLFCLAVFFVRMSSKNGLGQANNSVYALRVYAVALLNKAIELDVKHAKWDEKNMWLNNKKTNEWKCDLLGLDTGGLNANCSAQTFECMEKHIKNEAGESLFKSIRPTAWKF